MRRDVFQAIADPTRREIISMLSQKTMHLNAIAENFEISRPAISKHIKILTECGLIIIRQEGRERYCHAQLRQLQSVQQWVAQYSEFWNKKMDALGDFLGKENSNSRKSKHQKSK